MQVFLEILKLQFSFLALKMLDGKGSLVKATE